MDVLESFRIFSRVAELGGFSRAAESLGLPKASVSTAVQRLEAMLGAQLLHRTTRRVQLTRDGAALHERVRDFLSEADELQSMFRGDARALRGRLRVDMSHGIARHHVMPRLGEFLQRHPQIEIEVSCTDRRVDVVREGFDCVVRVGGIGDDSLIARPLGALRVINAASADYVREHGLPRTIDDLARHRLVHYVNAFGQRSSGFEYATAEGYATVEMAGTVTVNNADAYQGAALAGLGIIQAPWIGLRDLIASGRLVEIFAHAPPEPMPITLLYPRRRYVPARVRAFMDWIAEILMPLMIETPSA